MEKQSEKGKSAKAVYLDEETGEYVPFAEAEETRGKRPTVLTQSINFRIAPEAKLMLQDIADYEFVKKISELVRGWVLEKIKSYQANPRFKAFMKKMREREERQQLERKRIEGMEE